MTKKPHNIDLLTLDELESKEINNIIDLAIDLKKQQKKGKEKPLLQNKTLAMIFEKPSTRTRVSFETGMFQLGGHALTLSPNDLQLSRGESIADTAKTLSRYVNVIMARVYDHKLLENLARNSSIPVINGLSDSYHPCQILADFMTIKEHKKNLKKIKIAWIGDGNNVCNSLILGCAKLKIQLSVAVPDGYEPEFDIVKIGKDAEVLEISDNPEAAVKDADVVMTDTFVSIHNTNSDRVKKFLPKFQVNQSLMNKAKKDAIFMHCLPAKRDQEVTSDVIDGSQSVVWDEAENRLHVQKALLVHLLGV
ncbi:MAG: ornithine carbamoyltransferase [Thermoproteota archaeon]|jgi:ornithine carbamoyltransferase|nr:ornithine carbamoyltransferase [Thermoproteota archaeon]MEC9033315.1 ornithine carbamoyltransferase [Thermoproteota archaeon]MEC9063464.1 ornithine carbamoyltransferase [Thermoproteota archaeon]MEC9073565.1 ornithine carbamoyltransferase [Thermoproteota archaeon]|tara:strand:+ start:207 stop:1127 length:921 start_codon:yes stop_codon:yes gene_type:complete